MAKIVLTLFLAGCLVGAVFSSRPKFDTDGTIWPKDWCEPQFMIPPEVLQQFIDYACRRHPLDCLPIQPGGACFEPNTLYYHAFYALTLDYRRHGRCDGAVGWKTSRDPSHGDCQYP